MDNAPVHLRPLLEVECARVGVLILFLPPYGFVLNPTELVINGARKLMQRRYGIAGALWPQNLTIGQVISQCCFASVTPSIACNYFEHCGIPVTADDREWAING